MNQPTYQWKRREDRNTAKERSQKHGKEPGQKMPCSCQPLLPVKKTNQKKLEPAMSQRWCARIGLVEFAMNNVDVS